MKKTSPILFPVVAAFLAATLPLHAEIRISGVFADHMVLQREAQVPVWGWAAAGEEVTVAFFGQKKTVTADAAGNWSVKLDPMPASTEPHELIATAKSNTVLSKIKVGDVLVGDVWLCSGQSNMEFPMSKLKGTIYAGDLTTAQFPLIRQGKVPRNYSIAPANNTLVRWGSCTPQSVGEFTAAGFYFARVVSKELGVPVGLLNSSWGGTRAESWTSKAALDHVPDFKARADGQIASLEKLPGRVKSFPAELAAWEKENGRADAENIGEKNGWQRTDADISGWHKAVINAKWRDSGLKNGGIAWLRKEVELPVARAGQGIHLDLGRVDEQCVTAYWNGEKLGESGKSAPDFYFSYVHFDVPPRLVKPGKNVFALRFVVDTADKTPVSRHARELGFFDPGLPDLSDECFVKVEKEFPPLEQSALAARPATPMTNGEHTSSTLFGGMINPLIPFAIKGVLWYQGESDSLDAFAYRALLPLMIRDWRARWGYDFPFLIQQLPNFKTRSVENWAEIREAQALAAKEIVNCDISVGIDIGEANDGHPKNKREIGRRLALVALAKVYGEPVDYCGPIYDSMNVEGQAIRLKFKFTNGLKSRDGRPLKNFAIAGADQKFVPAEAKIDGATLMVSNPQVAAPVAVRYAFVNDPEGCNFSNASGLPAIPFRTDEWADGTGSAK
ncbi:MAG: sialic acid-specific 9-O-acetylesterase [Pedosphaera sp.]|nr:sialic acid-specific 9-O-acetylesterase [Pedosphaera sp.]